MQKRQTHTTYGDAAQINDAYKAQTRKRRRNLSKQNEYNRRTSISIFCVCFFLKFSLRDFFYSRITAYQLICQYFVNILFNEKQKNKNKNEYFLNIKMNVWKGFSFANNIVVVQSMWWLFCYVKMQIVQWKCVPKIAPTKISNRMKNDVTQFLLCCVNDITQNTASEEEKDLWIYSYKTNTWMREHRHICTIQYGRQ